MPTFYLQGNLIHYAAFKDHYSLFPSPTATGTFEKELSPYRTGKGTLSFPIDKPIPWEIIERVLQFRIKRNFEKDGKEEKKKTEQNQLHITIGNCYGGDYAPPPGFQSARSPKGSHASFHPHFASPGLAAQALIRAGKTSVTCNVM